MALPTVTHLKEDAEANVAVLQKLEPSLTVVENEVTGNGFTTVSGQRVAVDSSGSAYVIPADTDIVGGMVLGTDSSNETEISNVDAVEINSQSYIQVGSTFMNVVYWMYWAV